MNIKNDMLKDAGLIDKDAGMTLQELIEFEKTASDEELNEALKIFKQSAKFAKYADRIEAKLTSTKSKGKIDGPQIKIIQGVIDEARTGAKEFERVEAKFKDKTLDRSKAKEEIKRLKKKYSGLIKKLKSDKVKTAMKMIGGAALLAGFLGILGGVFGVGTGSFITKAQSFWQTN